MKKPMIQIEALGITLAGKPILEGISLSVDGGEYVSIIGPNGAGKTTLLKCIAGIHAHWTGSISIAGQPFSEYRAKDRAKIQSYVPQAEGRSIPLSVEEFVAMGRYPHLSAFTSLKPEDHQAINHALDQAGLDSFRHRSMNTLSGGERQMVFIAAALAQQSQILLLDEPATFLDYRHQAAIASLLERACRENGITVVAVHHDVNTAMACSDRIFAIKKGAIVFEGTPVETADEEVLQSIYDTGFNCIPSPRSPLPFITAGGTP